MRGRDAARTARVLFTACFVFVLAASAPLASAEITVTYRFESPYCERLNDGFSRIFFESTVQAGRPGEPSYPFRGVAILLPPGEELIAVRIERRNWTLLPEKHLLYPRQHPVPAAESTGGGSGLLLRSAAYDASDWIHPPDGDFTTHYLRGHAIAIGAFSPVAYLPAQRTAGYYREVDVTVETAATARSSASLAFLRTDDETNARITAITDNPPALYAYGPAMPLSQSQDEVYEYLIVTRLDLVDDLSPLRDFYTRRGLRTKIVSVEWIETLYLGTDSAEKLRKAIIDEYLLHHITHVLLGGDGDGPPDDPKTVPYRGLYCAVQSSSYYEDDNIPADLYFAALDGTWNDDGDDRWGEPGEEDFFSEIAVGRACIETPEQAATFIAKTIMYQDAPVTGDARSALMLGEKLWNNPLTYGGDELDQLIGTCSAYGFTTTGIPPGFDITKYYDRDLGSWSKTAVFGAVSAGVNWISHAGHCSSGYCMRMVRSDISDTNFTNDGTNAGFAIFNSYGCYAGSFDNRGTSSYETSDCIGELMVSIEHCAVAFLGNSRYGWLTEGTTNGPSHHFQREFFDALFTEGFTTLGDANQRSKDETVPFIDLPDEYEPGAHRWCFYTLNLLGDPALDGWTDTPESLAVTHPASFDRSAQSIPVETGEGGAVAVLCHAGVCYGRGIADGTGHIDIARYLHLPDSVTSIEFSVRAHNRYVYRDTLAIDGTSGAEADIPRVVLHQNVPNPFNPYTVIRFTCANEGDVDLRVYDVTGREIDRILRAHLGGGMHTVTWRPERLPSGVYLYVLRAGGHTLTRKAVLMR